MATSTAEIESVNAEPVVKISKAEKKRLQALLKFENDARQQGYQRIAGVDEAGRGPLAGPVVACACILPDDAVFPSINDSKQLSAEQRETLYKSLTSNTKVQFGIGIVDHTIIDAINILQATIQAMLIAIERLAPKPDLLLIDGMKIPHPEIPMQKIIKGDELSQSIAAASILAKVTRDRLMEEYHASWPSYGFRNNKGYGTPEHLKALREFGPCPIHRMSFSPCLTPESAPPICAQSSER